MWSKNNSFVATETPPMSTETLPELVTYLLARWLFLQPVADPTRLSIRRPPRPTPDFYKYG